MHPYPMSSSPGPRIARRSLLSFPFLSVALLAGKRHPFQFHHENVLGTSMELIVNTASDREAASAEAAALTEIDRLAKILSTYLPESEINRIERSGARPSPELSSILSGYRLWEGRTDGAISLTATKNGWNVDAL